MKRKLNGKRLVLTSFFALFVAILLVASSAMSVTVDPKNNAKEETTFEQANPDAGETSRGTVIFSEGFEGYVPGGEGEIPGDWAIYNVDADLYEWETYDYIPYEGTYHVRCHWNSAGCDDWLVTPMVHVPAGGDTFEFQALAYSSSYLEEWEVWITTTGNTVSDFTGSGAMIGSDSTTSSTYAPYSYAIPSSYNDADVYIAIRCTSVDAFYLYIDAVTMPNLGFFEGFEGTASSGFPPAGWSIDQTCTDTGSTIPGFWSGTDYDANSGNYAAGLWWYYSHQDERLKTPPITLTGSAYPTYYLEFWTYGWEGSIYDDHYYVEVSDDGGSSWTPIFDLTDLTLGDWNAWDYPYVLDLGAYAEQTIQLAWHAIDCNDPENPDYPGLWYVWIIDDIEVGYTEVPDHDCGVTNIITPDGSLGAGVITPEVTVENFGLQDETAVPVHMEITKLGAEATILEEGFEDYDPGTPGGIPTSWLMLSDDTYEYGYWLSYNYASHVYMGDYSIEGNPGEPSSDPHSDAWLITEQLTLSGSPGDLTFWYQSESDSHWVAFKVLVTKEADPTDLAEYTELADMTATTTTWNQAVIDMSDYAGEDVYIALQMYDSDVGYYYMFVDEFALDGWTEGFEGVPGSGFPPAGWTHEVVSGTDTDNEWDASDGTSTHPSGVIPNSGSIMAQYDSYFISSGNSARLYTNALSFTGLSTVTLRFWMNHDTGYSSSDDRIEIEASTDGMTWDYIGSVSRNDGTTGWAEHTFDLSAYAGESTVYVGFLGVSAYGNSIYMDDVYITAPAGSTVVYDETVYTDIISGVSQNVLFPDWTPTLKQSSADYIVTACTELTTDSVPDNDCSGGECTVLFETTDGTMIIGEPIPMYMIYAYHVSWVDVNLTIYVGEFTDGHTASDVVPESVMIDGIIVPDRVTVLESHPDFEGEVLEITTDITPFILQHTPIWGVQTYDYTVSGIFNTGKLTGGAFFITEQVTISGFLGGDANADLKVDVGDAVYIINYVFKNGEAPLPSVCAGDVNGDDACNIGDAIYLINYIYKGGPEPIKDEDNSCGLKLL